jgi:asparagine synthase (glutamine-hydrolysing)
VCGIAGWANLRAASIGFDNLSAMSAQLAHRGPDDSGRRDWPDAGLAFRRLALLDLSSGNQPARSENGRYWSVFNGEIYNHAQLREELVRHGHRLHGTGDAELIPRLYQQFGVDFLNKLRGMFAIAIYDEETSDLFLARDGFGIKPLYWTTNSDHLVFASEVDALRAAGLIPPEPDPDAVWQYLGFGYVPEPMTMWPGVHMLAAGHVLQLRNHQMTLTRWWGPRFAPDDSLNADDVAGRLLTTVEDSVRAHLAADVPVGSYLSSGVDSSLVTALAARQQPDLHTFSIGFEGTDDGLDELRHARDLARQLGTEHHEQVISAADYWRMLPNIVASQQEPLADPSAPALWFLAEQAQEHVKAVLSGEGADELFAGYPIYREPAALNAVGTLPGPVQRGLGRLALRMPPHRRGRGYLLRGTTPLERRFLGNVQIFTEEAKEALIAADTIRDGLRASTDLVQANYAKTTGLDDVSRMQAVSCHTWLPSSILRKADMMSMAHSLEVRVPFLDRNVFEIAATLPLRLRIDGELTKVALRRAASTVLPEQIAMRPKLGFPVPFRSWLNGPVATEVRDLFATSDDPLLDQTRLLALLDGGSGATHERRVWTLTTYLLWRRAQYTSHPAAARPCDRGDGTLTR